MIFFGVITVSSGFGELTLNFPFYDLKWNGLEYDVYYGLSFTVTVCATTSLMTINF